MTLTMMLLLAAAIVLPLVWIARRHSTGKTVKKPLIAHCFSFFALVSEDKGAGKSNAGSMSVDEQRYASVLDLYYQALYAHQEEWGPP